MIVANQLDSLTIKRATNDDLGDVLALLSEVNLPTEGVAECFDSFYVARDDERLAGCVGQERQGEVTLLRSLAVSPALQRGGLGKALTERLIDEARTIGLREIVLLTTTARDFFAGHFGFIETRRADFDEVFANSIEWHLPRCSSAVCMRLKVDSSFR